MKEPATARGKTSERGRRAATPAPMVKAARLSPRKQIKASRGSGGPVKTRKVAEPRKAVAPRGASRTAAPRSSARTAAPRNSARTTAPRSKASDRRVADTRRASLSSLSANSHRPTGRSASRQMPSGGGAVRAVAAGAGGTAAAAARVVAEPVRAVTRPALRVVSGGLEKLPAAANAATPVARGRILIMLAGLLAAGLIYINVGKLEYGDGYGRYAQRSLELQRENTALRARIANLSSAERIQRYAKARGMIVPAPEQYDYLRSKRGDAMKATRGYTAPDKTATTTAPATQETSAQTANPPVAMETTPQTVAQQPAVQPVQPVQNPAPVPGAAAPTP